MTEITENSKEKAVLVLEQALDIYQQFLDLVQNQIIEPFKEGNAEEYKYNLAKFGKALNILDIIKLVVRGASLLIPLISKILTGNNEKKYLDEKEIAERTTFYQQRLKNILKSDI